MSIITEAREQGYIFEWARYHEQRFSELCLLHHVPNGGRRDKKEAASLKRQGLKAGVPDIVLPVGRGGFLGLYIELKVGKNKPTEKQLEWIGKLQEENYFVKVCYGWREATEVITSYLEQPKTIVNK